MIFLDYLLLSFKTDGGNCVRPLWVSDFVSIEYNKRFPRKPAAPGVASEPLGGVKPGSYVYPRLQYKVIRGAPMIAAINEGCELLWDLYDKIDSAGLEQGGCKVTEKRLIEKKAPFGICEEFRKYRFLTPWLCLPEGEFKRYLLAGYDERNKLLARVLDGQIKSAAESLGYDLGQALQIRLNIKPNYIFQREIHVAGLFGSFLANFEFPSFLGIGKSVSRGFGAVKQM
jgi:hypothetical protein